MTEDVKIGGVKFTIGKQTAEGEMMNAEVLVQAIDGDPIEGLRTVLRPVLTVMDDRLLEMNLRTIAANTRTRELDPRTQMLVHEVFELLYGRKELREVAAAVQANTADAQPFASDRPATPTLTVIDGGREEGA